MLGSLGKYAGLMAYAGKRLEDITVADLGHISSTLGFKVDVTEELRDAGMALLQGRDIHTVADMIQSPESIGMLIEMLRGAAEGLNNGVELRKRALDNLPNVTTSAIGELGGPAYISSPLVGWRLPNFN